KSAEEAMLLADRLRFLVSRVPFLLRLQARLGASEILSDAFDRMKGVEQSFSKASAEARPLIRDLSALTQQSREAVHEAREVIAELSPIVERLPPPGELRQTIGAADQLGNTTLLLLDRTEAVLGRVETLSHQGAAGEAALGAAEKHLDQIMRKASLYLI